MSPCRLPPDPDKHDYGNAMSPNHCSLGLKSTTRFHNPLPQHAQAISLIGVPSSPATPPTPSSRAITQLLHTAIAHSCYCPLSIHRTHLIVPDSTLSSTPVLSIPPGISPAQPSQRYMVSDDGVAHKREVRSREAGTIAPISGCVRNSVRRSSSRLFRRTFCFSS